MHKRVINGITLFYFANLGINIFLTSFILVFTTAEVQDTVGCFSVLALAPLSFNFLSFQCLVFSFFYSCLNFTEAKFLVLNL